MKYVEACERGLWHLRLWHPDDPTKQVRCPYRCRSWRHEGECRHWKGAQDFVRIREALAAEKEWVYIVLTFAQSQWKNVYDQYRAGVAMWSKLRKRITRAYGMIKYVQTWERFRRGGVHVNVVVWNVEMFGAVLVNRQRFQREFLTPAATSCGFGKRTWVEAIRGGTGAMAGYLAKLGRELTGSGKEYQIPVDAPRHFRRIRASAHTLPPPNRTEFTGRLEMVPLPESHVDSKPRAAYNGRHERTTQAVRAERADGLGFPLGTGRPS